MIVLVVLLLVLLVLDVSLGTVKIPFGDIVTYFFGNGSLSLQHELILTDFRIPRLITALLAGSALAVSGLQMQTIFRNPAGRTLRTWHQLRSEPGGRIGAAGYRCHYLRDPGPMGYCNSGLAGRRLGDVHPAAGDHADPQHHDHPDSRDHVQQRPLGDHQHHAVFRQCCSTEIVCDLEPRQPRRCVGQFPLRAGYNDHTGFGTLALFSKRAERNDDGGGGGWNAGGEYYGYADFGVHQHKRAGRKYYRFLRTDWFYWDRRAAYHPFLYRQGGYALPAAGDHVDGNGCAGFE